MAAGFWAENGSPVEGNRALCMAGPREAIPAWPGAPIMAFLSGLKSGWDIATFERTWLSTVAAAVFVVTAL